MTKIEPTILILDDEHLQILSLKAQLKGLGKFVTFKDPAIALDHVKENQVDVAIVDIRMPGYSMDGLEFMRRLRAIDKDLSIVVRTADESDEISDTALELKASRRFIKSRYALREIQSFTAAAIAETEAKRQQTSALLDAEATRSNLVEALGTYDMTVTAGSVYRGLLYSLKNDLSALDSISELIKMQATANPDIADLASQHERLVGKMVREYDQYLESPFGDDPTGDTAKLNATFASLRSYFAGATEWISIKKGVQIQDAMNEANIRFHPLALYNSLKHLVEYCLIRMPFQSELRVETRLFESGKETATKDEKAVLTINAGAVASMGSCALLRLTGQLPMLSEEERKNIADAKTSALRAGNMMILVQTLVGTGGAIAFLATHQKHLAIEVLLPISET
jgi:CheY-like chemotaxis protein